MSLTFVAPVVAFVDHGDNALQLLEYAIAQYDITITSHSIIEATATSTATTSK